MTTRLHQAIDERTFHLDYQPVFELATRRMIGVEALLRWRDPFGNPIPPDAFILLAERTGLIAPITDWVIEQVCRQRLAWRPASKRTHSPRGRMSPVSSQMGMKSAGFTRPLVGWAQRTRASTPTTSAVASEHFGW